MLGCSIILALLTYIGYRLLRVTDRGVGVDLSFPPTAYGLFFSLYHLFPYLLGVSGGDIPRRNELLIASLLFLAFAGWQLGILISPLRGRKPIPLDWVRPVDRQALTLVCLLALILVAASFGSRIASGTLNTHAEYVELDTTVEASVIQVVGQELQLPLLLLLGFLAYTEPVQGPALSRWLYYAYAAGLFLLYLPGSQTRPAITVLLFVVFNHGLYRPFVLRPQQVAVLVGAAALAVIVIQLQRMQAPAGTVAQSMPEMSESVRFRACGGLVFLSDIIDASTANGHLHGSAILAGLPGLIPRILWPGKPFTEPIKLDVQRRMGLTVGDAAFTSICEGYAEEGIIGVVACHMLLGLAIGLLFHRLLSRPSFFVLFVFFFLWSQVVQMELELVIGSLSTLRTALFLYVLFLLIRGVLSRLQLAQAIPSSPIPRPYLQPTPPSASLPQQPSAPYRNGN
jgi:hypothetical protein